MENKKGQGISISTLVIVALAVFVLFLVIGFVTSGWGFFTQQFSVAKQSPEDIARSKCSSGLGKWQAAGSPEMGDDDASDASSWSDLGYWSKKICCNRTDVDMDQNGTIGSDDAYICCDPGSITSGAYSHGPLMSSSECQGACSEVECL